MAQTLKAIRKAYAEHVCAVAESDWPPLLAAFATCLLYTSPSPRDS